MARCLNLPVNILLRNSFWICLTQGKDLHATYKNIAHYLNKFWGVRMFKMIVTDKESFCCSIFISSDYLGSMQLET